MSLRGVMVSTGVVYCVGVINAYDVLSSVSPLAAAAHPGTGKLEILVNAEADWKDSAKVAIL